MLQNLGLTTLVFGSAARSAEHGNRNDHRKAIRALAPDASIQPVLDLPLDSLRLNEQVSLFWPFDYTLSRVDPYCSKERQKTRAGCFVPKKDKLSKETRGLHREDFPVLNRALDDFSK